MFVRPVFAVGVLSNLPLMTLEMQARLNVLRVRSRVMHLRIEG